MESKVELYHSFPLITSVTRKDSLEEMYTNGASAVTGGYGILPRFVPVKSKYSSTETELSSEDDETLGNRYRRDSTGLLTLSGFSVGTKPKYGNGLNLQTPIPKEKTSASSSGLSSRRKRRRKRRYPILSSLSSNEEADNLNSSLKSCSRSSISNLSQGRRLSSSNTSEKSWGKLERSQLPVLNSVNDLKNATGRHRGISGSSAPGVDSILFAMFYSTDIFDPVLKDVVGWRHYASESVENYRMRRDILGILRKEIVYSLRMSYFCPAGKIIKLLRILEENFPLEQIQDTANFVDLFFSRVVNHKPPFITYSNGSSNYVFHLALGEQLYFTRNYSRFESPVFTIQDLLQSYVNREGGGNDQFASVPYPAFILKLSRGKGDSHEEEGEEYDDILPRSGSHCHCSNHRQKYPVIPNMRIELTTLISVNGNHRNHKQRRNELEGSLSNSLIASSNFTSTSFPSSQNGLIQPHPNNDGETGHVLVVGGSQSRLLRGLKSAWKSMYRYIEDFASTPSTHFPPFEDSFMGNYNNPGGFPSTISSSTSSSSVQSSFHPKNYDDNHYYQQHHRQKNQHQYHSTLSVSASPSSSSSLSFMSCSAHPQHKRKDIISLENASFPTTRRGKIGRKEEQAPKPVVEMELIAVVCKSDGNLCQCNNRVNRNWRMGNGDTKKHFSGYSVYSKAKASSTLYNNENENENGGGYAPWLLYQSRCGVAPQVSVIENFGKWISSLERDKEDLSMDRVPREIRRVLEDSELLIYQRI